MASRNPTSASYTASVPRSRYVVKPARRALRQWFTARMVLSIGDSSRI